MAPYIPKGFTERIIKEKHHEKFKTFVVNGLSDSMKK